MNRIRVLLDREYDAGDGTRVINCVAHAQRPITERPDACALCLTDLRNQMRRALEVNAWLNDWKREAVNILSGLAGDEERERES